MHPLFLIRILLLAALCYWCVPHLHGQGFQRIYDVPVVVDGTPLRNPWAGGLNSCQVSHFDANFDGKKDLFIFDKTNSRISVYLNEDDTPGVISYKYTAEYNHVFPTGIRNWAFMRDMNCDGKEDLLVNIGGSFCIYYNTSDGALSFSPTPTPPVQALYEVEGGNSFTASIYSVAPDISAFEDIDNDGDIDVITWTENASSLYLFINMAVENGDCSTPQFVCRGLCYGMIKEAPDSFELFTGYECDIDVPNPRSLEEGADRDRHVGGTIMLIDLDQNGIKDLILGDVGNNDLFALPLTTSSTGRDSAMHVIPDFPADFGNTIPVHLDVFPAGFYLDINNDGVKDLVVSSNAFSDAEDRFSMWLYLNNGQDDLPSFELVQFDFLQNEQIDIGTGAYPVIADINQDGKPDLLVANYRYYDGLNGYTNRIHYYQNIGTVSQPAFELADDDWLSVSNYQWRGVYPAFGDLDGDGDLDLILGDQDGTLHFFRNNGTGSEFLFELEETALKDHLNVVIDIGQFSIPQLVDLNDDGKLDLVIGEYNGNINYYENIGTPLEPLFIHRADTLGNVVATSILGIQGKSVPHFFKNASGQWELLIGTDTGQINHYRNISSNLTGTFELVTLNYAGILDGERSAPFLADIDGDGLRELLVGNFGGGLGYYKGVIASVAEVSPSSRMRIYPNPAHHHVTIDFEHWIHENAELHVYDTTGRIVLQAALTSLPHTFSVNQLQPGVYIITVRAAQYHATERIIIQR
ncbi:MAG TPA: T9SS type A sorting domain-containing protein [Flavobacteriales bacterium]